MKTILILSMVILTQCALLDTSILSRYEQGVKEQPVMIQSHRSQQRQESPRYTLQNSLKSPMPFEKEMIHKSDIYLGMNEYSVRASWGQPEQVESAGAGNSKFQRWIYKKMIPTTTGYLKEERLVFFEEGRVVGWETH